MTQTLESIAQAYFNALKAKDFAALRSLLDDGATFRGPLGSADGADECVQGLIGMSKIVTDIVIQKIFVNDADVLTWYDLHTSAAPPLPTANWSHVENGKITAIRATFDPRPLTSNDGH